MLLHHSVFLHHSLLLHHLREAALFTPFLAYSYYLVAAVCAVLFFRQRRTLRPAYTPPVSILKPVRGVDREAYENFASFCRLDYPEYEILFGVADANDPVAPIIRKLINDFPNCSIRLLVGMAKHGLNEKASILAHLSRLAKYDLQVISDSDTRVAPDCLRAVAAPFRDAQVGAVTCLYRGERQKTLADAIEAVGISSDFFAGVFVAEQFAGAKFALGATMAVTRARLDQIGGFEALSDYLLDDYELGRRVAESGFRVELIPYTVSMVLPAETIRGYWRRQLRWAVGVRNSRPWGHFGLLITQGLPLTLAAMLASHSARESSLYLAAYFVTRYTMAWTVGVWGLRDTVLLKKWWLAPARDALAFCAWVASLRYSRVKWRGDAFYIRKGRLITY
ncbi:MAG: bacteriohopanetetrol glucosamine biosynthesis glycosyltransferase HpnI [Terriglobia bacterium]